MLNLRFISYLILKPRMPFHCGMNAMKGMYFIQIVQNDLGRQLHSNIHMLHPEIKCTCDFVRNLLRVWRLAQQLLIYLLSLSVNKS